MYQAAYCLATSVFAAAGGMFRQASISPPPTTKTARQELQGDRQIRLFMVALPCWKFVDHRQMAVTEKVGFDRARANHEAVLRLETAHSDQRTIPTCRAIVSSGA